MEYKEALDSISKDIIGLGTEDTNFSKSLLTIDSIENLNIYRRNLFGGILKSLSEDFVVVHKYLGDDNFSFFVRQFLIDVGVKSISFSEISSLFPDFLLKSFDIHQDDLVKPLADMDLIWSSGKYNTSIKVPFGISLYWSCLESDKATKDVLINLDKNETVSIILNDGEKKLVVDYK